MTALTATSIQEMQTGVNVASGTTPRRIKMAFIEVTSTGTSDTLDLSSIFPNDIVAIQETLDGAANGGTANTWSTYTITFAGHAGSGVWELIVWGY